MWKKYKRRYFLKIKIRWKVWFRGQILFVLKQQNIEITTKDKTSRTTLQDIYIIYRCKNDIAKIFI